jgi:hypothetical protein
MRSERPPDLITGAGARPRQELHAAAASMGLRQVLDKLCQSSAEKGGKKGEKERNVRTSLSDRWDRLSEQHRP